MILCAQKSDERIELFELAKRGIRVGEYLTELPPKKVLSRNSMTRYDWRRPACKPPNDHE